jgi:hypothetical protein
MSMSQASATQVDVGEAFGFVCDTLNPVNGMRCCKPTWSVGLLIAVVAPVQLLPVIFAQVSTPLIFTSYALYSWS